MSKYVEIQMDAWRRAQHCAVFRDSAQPQYCVTFDVDITNFLYMVRRNDLSFTLAFIYAVAKCANEIEEFRYRFLDGKVVLYDTIGTTFTHLEGDDDLFKVINVPMYDSMNEYMAAASKAIESQKTYFAGPPGNDVFVFSSMPWITYTHISHTDPGKKDNAVPLFDWGKYREVNGRMMMPFSVQVHHSFVDGIHIGKLSASVQRYMDSYKFYI